MLNKYFISNKPKSFLCRRLETKRCSVRNVEFGFRRKAQARTNSFSETKGCYSIKLQQPSYICLIPCISSAGQTAVCPDRFPYARQIRASCQVSYSHRSAAFHCNKSNYTTAFKGKVCDVSAAADSLGYHAFALRRPVLGVGQVNKHVFRALPAVNTPDVVGPYICIK